MQSELTGRDLYVRVTEIKSGGAVSHIRCHRVWDATRFFEALSRDLEREGAVAEVVSREDYLRSIKREARGRERQEG